MPKQAVTKAGNPADPCDYPGCGQTISRSWMTSHKKRVHGIPAGRRGGRGKNHPKAVATRSKAPSRVVAKVEVAAIRSELQALNGGPATYRELDNFKVLERADGSVWLAERLLRGV